MKNVVLVLSFFFFLSCKKESATTENPIDKTASATKPSGQELFEGTGNCTACHKPDQKVIGPSLQEIAKIYKEKNGSIVAFLQEQSEPIVDPSQYEVMKTNFAITKQMSEEELKALEDYILGFSQ
ncbi:c-type cytochrome [Flavobacterium silvisoli]|uniref:C-type cytochrome n=1 Tax=Flavobacterium silvisoli TaxID=2529433 RepID=A0A4Q9Z4C2_9FLAO|nr:c-type cytochrome [Flavobacterium silvisoli]TBX71293.1 c-type cytochrome [Flavobacterium silvisoli]